MQVRDAPSLRDVEAEELRQFFRGFSRNRVFPGPERNQLVSVFVKNQIAVHHSRDSDRTGRCQNRPGSFQKVFFQVFDTCLKSAVDLI